MNNLQIENWLRARAIKELSPDWVVWHPPRVKYFIVDIFGIADLIALNKKTGVVMLIQITTLTNRYSRRKKMIEFFSRHQISFNPFSNPFSLWSFDYERDRFAIEGF